MVCEDPTPVYAPDGGWGWVITFSSFMINVFIDGVTITFGIFFPEFLRYFGESKGKTQLLHSSMIGTLLIFGPVVSALVNKYGGRRAAGCGAVIASIGLFLSSFSPNLDVMIIFYSIVGGVGLGLLYVPPVVMVGIYFNKRRALATGIAVCGAGVGAFVFAPLSEFLLETYGWRGTMWILSAITLNCLIFSATYRPLKSGFDRSVTKDIKTDDYDQDHHDKNSEENSKVCCRKLCSSVKAMFDFSLLKSPTLLMYEASCFLVMLGFYIPPNFLPAWASDVNLSTEEGALLILSMGVSSTVMRVVIGYITDKPWANSLIINNTALLIGGVSTFCVPFYTTFVSLAAYGAVFGAVTASFTCLRSILMAELFGVQRLSSSLGWVGVGMGLATFVGSPIAGALSDTSGSYNVAFYFGGITLGFGGLICFPLRWISRWEKNRNIDFSVHVACGAGENKDINNVKTLSINRRTSIYTISEG